MAVNVKNVRNAIEVRFNYAYETEDSKETVLSDNYFIHANGMLVKGSRIEVWDKAMTYRMDLFVVQSTKLNVKVVVVNENDLQEVKSKPKAEKPAEDTGYTLKWRGKAKHSVIAANGIDVIKDGFDSVEEAKQWIEENK